MPFYAAILGRELLLVLMRLSRIPSVNAIWVDLLTNPSRFGLNEGQSFHPKTRNLDANVFSYTPETDTTTRSLMVNMIATMREHDNTITYLMLYFIKVMIKTRTQYGLQIIVFFVGYISFSLQQCAVDDDRLFAYLVPYVFQKLDVEAGASAAVSALLF
ncbi:unnamed protein product [Heligmosomoides polygyrus]|uniref:Ints3_N domain-containing protein n=1 Tax=Heligmosomoides polygyrus TaxID=6339 RepID=A0A183GB28_HELPZ|nr:unnamed protein product [Heligmosomoides polygyrus]